MSAEEKLHQSHKHIALPHYSTSTCPLSYPSAEVSPAERPEEEENSEVRDGRDDCGAADLYRLVPAALHVPCKVCSWSREHATGCVVRNHSGWLSGVGIVSFIKPFTTKQACFTEKKMIYKI